jgi:hypothetical protein
MVAIPSETPGANHEWPTNYHNYISLHLTISRGADPLRPLDKNAAFTLVCAGVIWTLIWIINANGEV